MYSLQVICLENRNHLKCELNFSHDYYLIMLVSSFYTQICLYIMLVNETHFENLPKGFSNAKTQLHLTNRSSSIK